MSICMFLQNITKIQCFLPSVWATEIPEKAVEKNGTKKKKKVGNPIRGSCQRTGCPDDYKARNTQKGHVADNCYQAVYHNVTPCILVYMRIYYY